VTLKESSSTQKETEEEVPTKEIIKEVPTQVTETETNVEEIVKEVAYFNENDYFMDYNDNEDEQKFHSVGTLESQNELPGESASPKRSPQKSDFAKESPKRSPLKLASEKEPSHISDSTNESLHNSDAQIRSESNSPQKSSTNQIKSFLGVINDSPKESTIDKPIQLEPITQQKNTSSLESSITKESSITLAHNLQQSQNSPVKSMGQSKQNTLTDVSDKSPSASPKKSPQRITKSSIVSPKKTLLNLEEHNHETSHYETFIESTIPDDSNSSIDMPSEPITNKPSVYENLVERSSDQESGESNGYLDYMNCRKSVLHNSELDLDFQQKVTATHRASSSHANLPNENDSTSQEALHDEHENFPGINSKMSELDPTSMHRTSLSTHKASIPCETFSVMRLNYNNQIEENRPSIPFDEVYDKSDGDLSNERQQSPNKNKALAESLNESDNDKTLKTNKENVHDCNY
jgi:hypothetical protein